MNNTEIWKDIPYYKGIYQVSNLGRIRTCEEKVSYTKYHGIRHWKPKILKQKKCPNGYHITLWKNNKPHYYLVHRLVGCTFLGKSHLTINHINGNRFDNRIENLEWCNGKENIQKAFEMGLYPQQKTKVIDKKTNEVYMFRSMSQASQFMGMSNGYVSNCLKHNKKENDNYKWETN